MSSIIIPEETLRLLSAQPKSLTTGHKHDGFRPEVQGLRAIAVAIVVIFHIWPAALPGGYVGVDVFFVISGYLITGLLFREAVSSGSLNLPAFYLRRVRRLLPAATLVLLSTGTMAFLFLPSTQWEDIAGQIVACVFYVQNWHLAQLAVDYLGAENAPSPLQHYWSLSVEEQFYIIWPAMIIAMIAITSRFKQFFRQFLFGTLAFASIASLVFSIYYTKANPDAAYFVTTTRIWELGMGGLLALSQARLSGIKSTLAQISGIGLIVISCLMISQKTLFPGYAALLPVAGAILLLIPGDRRSPVGRLLSLGPMQYLGDISYPIYLWHWPLIVVFQAYVTKTVDVYSGLVICLATLALAHFTKVMVEDRFRRPEVYVGRQPAFVALFASPAMAAVLILGFINYSASRPLTAGDYPGALVLAGFSAPKVPHFAPSLETLRKDYPDAYRKGCHLGFPETTPKPCTYGDPKGKVTIFLVGDSHAANWIPALDEAGAKRGWRIRSYTKSSCAFTAATVMRKGQPYVECRAFANAILDAIKQTKPDIVLVSQYANKLPATGLVDIWKQVEATGARVIAIADTPHWKKEASDCLAKGRSNCSVKLADILAHDVQLDAAKVDGSVSVIDLNDSVCPKGDCNAVIGNVIVWRDRHHITATYSRSLGLVLGERLAKVIGG